MFPATNENEHMSMILELINLPSKDYMFSGLRWKHFFSKDGSAILFNDSEGRIHIPGSRLMESSAQSNDPLFISFLKV